jgi:hypothetical protein
MFPPLLAIRMNDLFVVRAALPFGFDYIAGGMAAINNSPIAGPGTRSAGRAEIRAARPARSNIDPGQECGRKSAQL